ncbi:MAG: hypothetical protein ACREA9_11230 [Pyrinomonadaceae bacterium]
MILETVFSLNNVPVRLTEERWEHIVGVHPYMTRHYEEMLDAVDDPEYILPGHKGSLIAVVGLRKKTILHVMYRELSKADGFIITAYTKTSFDKKKAIWPRG